VSRARHDMHEIKLKSYAFAWAVPKVSIHEGISNYLKLNRSADRFSTC